MRMTRLLIVVLCVMAIGCSKSEGTAESIPMAAVSRALGSRPEEPQRARAGDCGGGRFTPDRSWWIRGSSIGLTTIATRPLDPNKLTTTPITRISTAGGTPTVIADHQDDMGIDDGRQLVVYGDESLLDLRSRAGGQARDLYCAGGWRGSAPDRGRRRKSTTPLAVDASGIYWSDGDALKLVPLPGGRPKTISTKSTNDSPRS